jgi:hypothetical protein
MRNIEQILFFRVEKRRSRRLQECLTLHLLPESFHVQKQLRARNNWEKGTLKEGIN